VFRAGFEMIGAVLCGGFGSGRGLKREHGRKNFLWADNLHPPGGNVPSMTAMYLMRNVTGYRSYCIIDI